MICLCVGMLMTTMAVTVGPSCFVRGCGVTTLSIFHKHQQLNPIYVQIPDRVLNVTVGAYEGQTHEMKSIQSVKFY